MSVLHVSAILVEALSHLLSDTLTVGFGGTARPGPEVRTSAAGPYSSSKARLLLRVLRRTEILQTALGLCHGWFFFRKGAKIICSPASMHLHS